MKEIDILNAEVGRMRRELYEVRAVLQAHFDGEPHNPGYRPPEIAQDVADAIGELVAERNAAKKKVVELSAFLKNRSWREVYLGSRRLKADFALHPEQHARLMGLLYDDAPEVEK